MIGCAKVASQDCLLTAGWAQSLIDAVFDLLQKEADKETALAAEVGHLCAVMSGLSISSPKDKSPLRLDEGDDDDNDDNNSNDDEVDVAANDSSPESLPSFDDLALQSTTLGSIFGGICVLIFAA